MCSEGFSPGHSDGSYRWRIREELACTKPLLEFQDLGTRRMESRLTHIADMRNHNVPFWIGVWSQGMVTWRRIVLSACSHGHNFFQRPVDCFLEVHVVNRRLF
jgi:hypothetical protein